MKDLRGLHSFFLYNLCLEMDKKEWKNSMFIIQERVGKEREENK